jgi:peptidoglycan/LPS O-acetylase OafA/YrhL
MGDTGAPRRLAYQPALDGLRAFAVLAVLLYHDRALDLPGGFLGVDVFFVLSGFLITGILLADHARTGTTDSRAFWIRRARRLIPAFLALLLLVAVYTAFVSESGHPAELRAQGIAGLFYVANWQAIYSSDFAPTVLSHIWSLSVEEQWYLIWPFLLAGLLVTARRSRPRLLGAIVLLATASAIWMGWAAHHVTRSRAFFGTDTRAWELLAGAALAVVAARGADRRGRRRAAGAVDVAGVLGLAALVVAMLRFHETDYDLYPWGRLLVVVATVAVIVAAVAPDGRVVRPLLGWRPFVLVGLISYGIYLYHVPLFAWVSPEHVGVHGWPLLGLRLLVVLGVATASYRFLEMPIRRGELVRLHRLRLVVVPAAVVLVTVVFLGATVVASEPDEDTLALVEYQQLAETSPAGVTRLLVAGDATAFHLGWKFRLPFDADGVRGTVASTVRCGLAGGVPVIGTRPLGDGRCTPLADAYGGAVDAFDPAVTALMVGNTETFDRRVDGRILRVGSPALARHLEARLDEARAVLTAGGRPMILVSVPCADPDGSVDPDWAAIRSAPERIAWVNQVFERYAARHPRSVTFARLDDVLCPAGNPHPRIGPYPLRPDGVTLSAAGASAVWRWLAPVARDLAGAAPGGGRS